MQYARRQYIGQLIRKKDNGRDKVITGLRRSGKSYLLFTLYRQYLLSFGIDEDQIVGIALDEISNAKYRNPFELDRIVKERMLDKNKRYYVFIDEIQFVTEVQNPYVDDPNAKIIFIDVVLGLEPVHTNDNRRKSDIMNICRSHKSSTRRSQSIFQSSEGMSA